MSLYMKSSQQLLAAANTIRENLGAAVDQIGCQASLTPAAQTCLVAREFLKAKSAMDQLSGSTAAATAARTSLLNAKVWGVADVPGDRASVSISYRDAQDRAGALSNPHDAMYLLDTATRSGDELLSRAIASQGDTMGWTEVTDQYFGSRPAAAAAYAELQQLAPSLGSATDIFLYVLPAPVGLNAANPYRIQQIADNPAFATLR
jgi:hypothetical protein